MVKTKKHDKDKYYNLARQQGYRARSAFKLIQLNKKYDFLSTAKVCIDLCAAPGGWCQVAAKYMPASSIIIGIDLLPIRPIRGVKTFQCDITTPKCRQIIKQETQSWQVDVVLCDGAPNVGAQYSKDAYVQNELALVALKLAVDVMGRGATFVSKVFRSQDYNALLWVFKQMFKKVSATKPLSSRNESAEIFVVCEHYLAPHSIDPKLFDPKYVFDQVDAQEKSLTIFHPKFGVQKRHREGYDEALGMTLTNECSVSQFLDASDPIRLLTDTTSIRFQPEDQAYREQPETTDEIVTCLGDLRVLGKSEFKSLLKWRIKINQYRDEHEKKSDDNDDVHPTVHNEHKSTEVAKELTEEEKDALVREELAQLRANVQAKKKREKKKERERKMKLRVRAALGMNEQGIDVTEAESAFSLAELRLSKEKVDLLENAGGASSSSEESDADQDDSDDESNEADSEVEYEQELEAQMDKLYETFLAGQGEHFKSIRATKRSKVAKRALAREAVAEDAAMYDGDMEAYHKMINPEESSDDSDSDEDESGRLNVPLKFQERPNAAVSRWFAGNELFTGVEDDAEALEDDKEALALPVMPKTDREIRHEKRKHTRERKERRALKKLKTEEGFEDMDMMTSDFAVAPTANDDDEEKKSTTSATARASKNPTIEARKRELIRSGMGAAALDAANDLSNKDEFEVVSRDAQESESKSSELLPRVDDRLYDSEHEDYDGEDRAETLALATMMVRKSRAKEIIDDSYNRYAWNDPSDLPDWFVDDEQKHYRPQVPIPKPLLEQMKQRFLDLSTKPVKKVAEARARKQRQKLKKLKAAKKKAADIANLPDMSTREKLKAIERTMKGAQLKKQNKVYVVSRRGGRSSSSSSGGKKAGGKVKLVDPRLKKDTRNAKLRTKRGKKAKR